MVDHLSTRITGEAGGSFGSPRFQRPPRRGGWLWRALVLASCVATAGALSYVARRELAAAVAEDAARGLEPPRKMFELTRLRAQTDLGTQCRLLVEDPRLKAALSTEGVDEATLADILRELTRLRNGEMMLVLSPEGRVRAEAGAHELQGLDLSASSVVKKALAASDTVTGSWTIGDKVIDLAIAGVSFDQGVLAYLVTGHQVDHELVEGVAAATGTTIALIVGPTISVASSDEAKVWLAELARQPGQLAEQREIGGVTHAVAVSELEPIGQTRPRLVVARSLAPARDRFELLGWLLLVPPALVLVAGLLLAQGKSRRSYRAV